LDKSCSVPKIAEDAFKRGDKLAGVPTGFADLDKALGGMHRSDLVILAARTSMGKTAMAVNIACNAAEKRQGRRLLQPRNGQGAARQSRARRRERDPRRLGAPRRSQSGALHGIPEINVCPTGG